MSDRTDTGELSTELSAADHEQIRETCLDFLEGWYTGDAERVARALHPELVKRSVMPDEETKWRLRPSVTQAQMVEWTRQGGGTAVPEAERRYEISIDHAFRHIATVSTRSPEYVDYLHLARIGERWVIVHDLWERREGTLKE